jgi:hypothetical protein
MHILIISALDDAHIPFVSQHFPASVKYTVIDPFGAIGKYDVSYVFEDGKVQVYYGNVLLEDIDSVWFRKPTHLDKVKVPVPDSHKIYSVGALRRHLAPLYRHWERHFGFRRSRLSWPQKASHAS